MRKGGKKEGRKKKRKGGKKGIEKRERRREIYKPRKTLRRRGTDLLFFSF